MPPGGADDPERLERLAELGDPDALRRQLRDARRRDDVPATARAIAALPHPQRPAALSALEPSLLARLYTHLRDTHRHPLAILALRTLSPSWPRHLLTPDVAGTDEALYRLLAALPAPATRAELTRAAYPRLRHITRLTEESHPELFALEGRARCLEHLDARVDAAIGAGLIEDRGDALNPSPDYASALPALPAPPVTCWTCLDALLCHRCDGTGGLIATACFAEDARDALDWTLDNRWWAPCSTCHRTGGCPECRIHTALTRVEHALGVPLRDDERDALEGLGAPRVSALLRDGVRALLTRLAQFAAPRVDVNTATLAELSTLPGLTRERARAIIALRGSRGAFSALDDLREVDGVNQRILKSWRDVAVALAPD